MKTDPVVIVAYTRTPIGHFQGELSIFTGPELGSKAIKSALARANLTGQQIDEVTLGCVLPAGMGQAPARQAAIAAGIPVSTPATTINKMCGSGMQSVILAHDRLLAGASQICLAGGFESMSNAPYLLKKARTGYRLGHGELFDHMFIDGLEDAYQPGTLMGVFADRTANELAISREQQDNYAIASVERAIAATQSGVLSQEITPIQLETRHGQSLLMETDEGPRRAKPEKIPDLKPAFSKGGTVTPGNASSISDGAAALILTRLSTAEQLNLSPIARIASHHAHAQEPAWFTTAPAKAIEGVLEKTGWQASEVDLFEINEAFAVVALAAMKALQLPHEKVNINGGACVLGHPIGASGARILVTLLNALQQHQLKRGVASLCIGGGEATAMAIELIE